MSLPVPQGLNEVDNTQILQAAVSDGAFWLPQGVWPISRALVFPTSGGLSVGGINSYRSVIYQKTSSQPCFVGVDTQRITLRGLGLTGPGVAVGTAPGISLSRNVNPNTYGLLFEDVAIQQFGGNGIDGPAANVIVSGFERVTFGHIGGIGINLTGVPGGPAGTSVLFKSLYANDCGLAGYVLAKMNYSELEACACDNSGAGYVFQDCQGIGVKACGTEMIAATGEDMLSDGTCFRVDGCDGVDFGGSCWTRGNSHYVLHVSGRSVNIRGGRIGENEPLPSALGHTLVDSGSQYPS